MTEIVAAEEVERIVVLGGAGLVGEAVTRILSATYPGIKLDSLSSSDLDLTQTRSIDDLADLLDRKTVLVMCAALRREAGDDLSTFQKNMAMAVHLCSALEKVPPLQIIYFSSTAVYGEDIHWDGLNEQTPVTPRSYYGNAKFASERLLVKSAEKLKDTPLSILRPPVIYGPGDRNVNYGPATFAQKAQRGEQIVLWGDGTEKREFIYVDDVARVVEVLIAHPFHCILNLAAGVPSDFQEILQILKELLPVRLNVDSRPRSKDKVDHIFDNSQFRQLIPDFSFTPLKAGIEEVLAASSP